MRLSNGVLFQVVLPVLIGAVVAFLWVTRELKPDQVNLRSGESLATNQNGKPMSPDEIRDNVNWCKSMGKRAEAHKYYVACYPR